MKSLYEPSVAAEVRERINRLRADSPRDWGKMNAAQMLAHCAIAMEMALGERRTERHLIGRLIGRRVLRGFLGGKPLPEGAPTHPSGIVTDERDFDTERARLQQAIDRFTAGPHAATEHPHFFFGRMAPHEWAEFSYIHLDHHLRQFSS